MKRPALLVAGLLIAGAATAVMVYAPTLAERVWPGAALAGAKIAAYLPAKIAPSSSTTPAPKSGAPEAPARPPKPPVSVTTAQVQRGPLPYRIEAIGSVQPIASVAIRTRVDAQVDKIAVDDGAEVKAGDLLIKLDSRQIEAQLRQAEAQLLKDRAQLEQAERDVTRYAALILTKATPQMNFDNARTAVLSTRAAIAGDQAAIDNLKVQLSWHTITAPIAGRVGTFALKIGNIVRAGDSGPAATIATINQMSPIYVAISVSQRFLPELREAMASGKATARAKPQGHENWVEGRVAFLDNSVDSTTGTLSARSVFANKDETLWPGQLCDVRVTLRTDPDVVSLPRGAVQVGQRGHYVFVVEGTIAHVRRVTVGRDQEGRSTITDGLSGGETVVIDGATLLIDGARIQVREAAADKGNAG
ncbi:MAG: rane fusion protein multidrug efflux system [Methylobacteriaceae bacterium]|jgi:multidrug efflux system membrane fusion protein|nr:rane fusion protein multidrug efflux system [Methylobacteriaceae bacterium]